MTIEEYLSNVTRRYKTGISREHSYRGDLQTLLESLLPGVLVTNEPARIECGAPDFILTKKNIPVGYIEAKDIGEPLQGKKHKEQFDRYNESLPNLIFTDYTDFHLFVEGEFITSIEIAEIKNGTINPKPENFQNFTDLIKDFATTSSRSIKSSSKLSKMMAGKARLLSTVIEKALISDEKGQGNPANNTLREQLKAFQNVLIHDIDAKEFANIYAQTIAYGMFAGRLHDPTLETFTRQEASELIPKTNPFLRKLFQYIAGYDLDERIDWIVDALADIFRATDVNALLTDFGKATQQHDPIIHFYETFLSEFDPAMRKSRGVWYTPEPVVNFIVRAVDDILKEEFKLKDGLADTSKTTIKVKTDVLDKRTSSGYKEDEKEIHKVQILDPATGTGTFLAEIVKQIHSRFEGQQGIWPDYVENHLIPRLNGFEILMASYAMAHLKLDMLLRETGYNRESSQRFRIYLTNSLEEYHPDTGTLFASWLSEEANQANHVKRETPVMVVMGNPPYSGESSNKGGWIMKLMEDYKKEPGGKKKLQERNSKWINDDYVKFIRFGQQLIEKNGEGILAFINPHGYLDNPTFRGMRWNLLNTYDKIFTIDLHGNTKKKEVAPDGSVDENIFDIQQGVSINIFLKQKESTEKLGSIFQYDLYGTRKHKYNFLINNSLNDISFNELKNIEPHYFFTVKDFKRQKSYMTGFSTKELFPVNCSGIVTARDHFTIHGSKTSVKTTIQKFLELENEKARTEFKLGKDVRDWKIRLAKNDLKKSGPDFEKIIEISYRTFDNQYTYYTGNSKGFHCMPRGDVMKHFINKENIGFVTVSRQPINNPVSYYFLTNNIISNGYIRSDSVSIDNVSPLYLYYESNGQKSLSGKLKRKPNLDSGIVQTICGNLGLSFSSERNTSSEILTPLKLLDYIYAVLHSPTYRERYKEFLKIDFPRIPYPTDPDIFWQLIESGGELRKVHLLKHPVIDDFITTYPINGSNEVSNRLTKSDPGFIPYENDDNEPVRSSTDSRYPGEVLGKVQINEEQYFGDVPLKAWEFYIGGYQPAKKWLKDRRDRTLTFEEIQHYQKIIVALMETDRIMQEIDEIPFLD